MGGGSPYLALFARGGFSRAAVDAALAAREIHELPSARRCTYVVPASDYPLALRAAQGRGEDPEIAGAKKHLGVTDRELDALSTRMLDALDREALDPAALRERLGDAVRSLGEAGKKRGVTTTLPLVLGRLQVRGEIRRVPTNGRLDQQRYRYERWSPSPLAGVTLDDATVAIELARRFFGWAAPATVAHFVTWSGLTVKAAKEAVAALGLVSVGGEPERWISRDERDAMAAMDPKGGGEVRLVGSLDNLLHLRRNAEDLIDPTHCDLPVWGERGEASLGGLGDAAHHLVVADGRLVGFWEFTPDPPTLTHACFARAPRSLREALDRTLAMVRDELGDLRSFSLDSPEGRAPRVAALRKAKWRVD